MSDALEKVEPSALLEDVPAEAVEEVVTTVAETFSQVMETREMSRARQIELEQQLEALRARHQANRDSIQQLTEMLESEGDLLTEEQRGEVVSTICELALRD